MISVYHTGQAMSSMASERSGKWHNYVILLRRSKVMLGLDSVLVTGQLTYPASLLIIRPFQNNRCSKNRSFPWRSGRSPCGGVMGMVVFLELL